MADNNKQPQVPQQDLPKLKDLAEKLYQSFHASWKSDADRRVERLGIVVDFLRVMPTATASVISALMPWPAAENAPENADFKTVTRGAVGRYVQMAKAQLIGHNGRKIAAKELQSLVRSKGEQAVITELRAKGNRYIAPSKGRATAPKGEQKTGPKAEQSGIGILDGCRNTLINFKKKFGIVQAFSRPIEDVFVAASALREDMRALMERKYSERQNAPQGPPAGASKATVPVAAKQAGK